MPRARDTDQGEQQSRGARGAGCEVPGPGRVLGAAPQKTEGERREDGSTPPPQAELPRLPGAAASHSRNLQKRTACTGWTPCMDAGGGDSGSGSYSTSEQAQKGAGDSSDGRETCWAEEQVWLCELTFRAETESYSERRKGRARSHPHACGSRPPRTRRISK